MAKVGLSDPGPILYLRAEMQLHICVFCAGFAEVRLFCFWCPSASVCCLRAYPLNPPQRCLSSWFDVPPQKFANLLVRRCP